MADIIQQLALITKNVTSAADGVNMKAVIPEGTEKGAAPVSESNGKYTVAFSGEKGSFVIEAYGGKIYLKCSAAQYGSAVEADFTQQSASLFDPDTVDEKDIRYISNEFCDTIEKIYSKASKKQSNKLPTPVSKSAAKSGSVYYDTITLASRMTAIYPEMKEVYRSNIDTYGEFLPEDFFLNHCNKCIMDTIRENDPIRMRKLFNCLNEIYNDGTNEVQSVIVVTILGQMNGDEKMIANCVDYMEDMMLSVIETNKYLSKSAKARQKLSNPPAYKPKRKKKSGGFLSQLGQ